MRYAVRNDCMSEAAMLLALAATTTGRAEHAATATNLVNYVFGKSGLAGGPRTDPNSASYGLVGWSLDQPDTYWGDDNARAMLGVGVVAAVSNDRRWDELLVRDILANLRTTGRNGFRPSNLDDKTLQARGWKAYWTAWCQPWIAGTLALRQQKRSLWDLVQKVDLKSPFDRYRRSMPPDLPVHGSPRSAKLEVRYRSP